MCSSNSLSTQQISRRPRVLGGRQFPWRTIKDNLAATLTGAWAHVKQPIRSEHNLWIVLNHYQRIAGISESLHHADDARHITRVQADGRLVENEQGVGQGRAQRGGEVDALHFATGQRARLSIERQIAQADITQIAQPTTHFAEHQLARLIQNSPVTTKIQFTKKAA